MRSSFLALLLLLPAAACSGGPAAPTDEAVVVTPTVEGSVSGADVRFRVENLTSRPVFLARCGDRIMAAVDRWEDGRWAEHRSDACPATLAMVPLRLAPGEDASGAQVVQLAGRFRLRLGGSAGAGEAPAWNLTSPDFTVVR